LGETYVSDPDSILAAATVRKLNPILQALDQSGRAHLDVVLVRSIGEAVPKTAAHELFNRWKVGDKQKNNGLLMLVVLDQRRIEFETGYGLEADLPDVVCYRIQQRYMVPLARANRYDEAVRQGVAAIIRHLTTPAMSAAGAQDSLAAALALTETPGNAPDSESSASESPQGSRPAISQFSYVGIGVVGITWVLLYYALWQLKTEEGAWRRKLLGASLLLQTGIVIATFFLGVPHIIWLILGVLYWLPLLYLHGYLLVVNYRANAIYAQQGRHAQYGYLDKAHLDLGFTAYVFPVLLAFYWPWHGRHLRRLREAPYKCPGCNSPMHRLDEQADDEHLEPGQVAEEKILAVDYDVWQCGQCAQQMVLSYRNLASKALPVRVLQP
jgi:uncharacterized protein